jgi:hypothetical protein
MAAAQTHPRKVAIAPDSASGALLIDTPWLPSSYDLRLERIDDGRGRIHRIFSPPRLRTADGQFIVATLPAGTYRLNSVTMQRFWVGCLFDSTINFTVEPGAVSYIGRVNVAPTLASIADAATARRQLKSESLQFYRYRQNIAQPLVDGREPAELGRARAFVRAEMPRSSAAVVVAKVEQVSFRSKGWSAQADDCHIEKP